ncbi:hypothetical protein OSTOST_17736 [Ostertagia ostertagi]
MLIHSFLEFSLVAEIRAEAVQQALAEYSQGYKVRPSIVQPIKRPTETRRQFSRASDSSSDDDDSLVGSLKRKNQPSSKQNTGLDSRGNIKIPLTIPRESFV